MSDASTAVDDRFDTEEITEAEALVDEDTLVEEVSIDGMCGRRRVAWCRARQDGRALAAAPRRYPMTQRKALISAT
jgi:mycofactocin precursor